MNPPESQPADTAEKRRKQIEKAKAAHLSRQLQTRLQYARLKVDHGWQKQTLNEVENLYFHHYRARIPSRSMPKTERNVGGVPSAQTAPEQRSASTNPASTSFSSPTNQQVQRQPPLPDPAQSSTPAVPGESEPDGMEIDAPAAESPIITPMGRAMMATQPPPNNSVSPVVTSPTPQPPPAPQPPATMKTPPLPGPPVQSHPTQNLTSFSTTISTPTPSFVAPPSASRNPVYPQPSSSLMRGASSATRPSSSVMPPSMPSSSNAAMTYDSFWSSHSTTSNNYRSTLANAASFSSPGRGDAGMGVPNFGTGYPFAMGAPSAPFQPLPIPKRQAVSRKRPVPPAAAAGSVRHGLTGGEGGG